MYTKAHVKTSVFDPYDQGSGLLPSGPDRQSSTALLDPYDQGSGRQGDTFPAVDTGEPQAAAVDDSDSAHGVGGTSTTVAASGNPLIDGLLRGLKWNMTDITYADPDAAGDYQSGYTVDNNGNSISAQNEGFSQISAGQLLAVHYALNQSIYTQPLAAGGFSVEGFTNLGITYGVHGSGNATMRIANTSDNSFGLTFYPSNAVTGGDAWMGTDIRTPVQGNYSWNNTLHELGHGLGLKHGHEASGSFAALPSDHDSLEFTLMTYRSYIGAPTTGYTNGTWDYPQTYMMLDIAALQYMYGADFTTNNTDTVYTWSQTTGQGFVNGVLGTNPGDGAGGAANRVFMTIWDGGGTDTYDLSNYTTSMTIDLRPGEWSTFDSAQLANLDGVGGHMARGNVANAMQYQGNAASLIENANGGSGNDTMTGNDAVNVLSGNDGDDVINGGHRDDTINGNGGNDRFLMNSGDGIDNFDGGDGIDTIDFSGLGTFFVEVNLAQSIWKFQGGTSGSAIAIEKITGTGGEDSITGDSVRNFLSGADGNDTVNGGKGNDRVFGNLGDDVLKGAAGRDSLAGGLGKDTLTGGFDKDHFVFGSTDVSTVAATGRDLITDFRHGQHDKIDLADIDAEATPIDDQKFHFIKTDAFGHNEGELHYRHSGGNTFVTGDVDGDAVADFAIEVHGKLDLVKGDFVL